MSRYPNEDVRRFDQQFAETPAERREQRNRRKLAALITAVEDAIAHLPQTYALEIAKENKPHVIRRKLVAAVAEARQ